MVGIFSRFSGGWGHRRAQSAIDPILRGGSRIEEGGFAPLPGVHGIEVAAELKPVEHPTEPVILDQPVACPLPEPSIHNDGRLWKERRSTTAAMVRADLPIVKEGSHAQSRNGENKHTSSSSRTIISSSFSAPEHNIVALLDECNASGSHTSLIEEHALDVTLLS